MSALFGLASPVVTAAMQKKYAKWIDFLYGPIFRVIGFFYRNYSANRARVARLKASPRVSAFFRVVTVLLLVGWILIWLFAPEESRNRLTDEVRQTIGGIESGATR
jgi:hypothetical protein